MTPAGRASEMSSGTPPMTARRLTIWLVVVSAVPPALTAQTANYGSESPADRHDENSYSARRRAVSSDGRHSAARSALQSSGAAGAGTALHVGPVGRWNLVAARDRQRKLLEALRLAACLQAAERCGSMIWFLQRG
jgi:hypothetical protein